MVRIIVGLARHIADTPAEKGAGLDLVGTVLAALDWTGGDPRARQRPHRGGACFT